MQVLNPTINQIRRHANVRHLALQYHDQHNNKKHKLKYLADPVIVNWYTHQRQDKKMGLPYFKYLVLYYYTSSITQLYSCIMYKINKELDSR